MTIKWLDRVVIKENLEYQNLKDGWKEIKFSKSSTPNHFNFCLTRPSPTGDERRCGISLSIDNLLGRNIEKVFFSMKYPGDVLQIKLKNITDIEYRKILDFFK